MKGNARKSNCEQQPLSTVIALVLGAEDAEDFQRAERALPSLLSGGITNGRDAWEADIHRLAEEHAKQGPSGQGIREAQQSLDTFPPQDTRHACDLASDVYTEQVTAAYLIGLVAGWTLAQQIGGAR